MPATGEDRDRPCQHRPSRMSSSSVAAPTRRTEAFQTAAAERPQNSAPILSAKVANFALFVWLAGVLIFGRAFAEIGRAPVFLADVLAVSGVLLSLPRWWPFVTKPVVRGLLLIAAVLAVLTFQSVYRGAEAGYPSALKSACMGVYPLVAVAIAGLVVRDSELIHRFAKHVLPLVPLGFLLVALVGGTYIAASSGLYLACAAAWAAAPGNVRRAAIAVGTVIAAGYLAQVEAKRGPMLAILLAIVATRIATRKRLRSRRRQRQLTAAIMGCLSIALIVATAIVLSNTSSRTGPSELPIVGPLVSRLVASTQPGTESGNNILLRWEMWRYALITTAQEHPFIGRGAGRPIETGLGATVMVNRKSGAHNSFVGYAFYSGFPSAILVMIAFLMALINTWRYRAQPACASLFGATMAVAATCMTNVALETPFIAGPAWAVVGAALGAAAAARAEGYRARIRDP